MDKDGECVEYPGVGVHVEREYRERVLLCVLYGVSCCPYSISGVTQGVDVTDGEHGVPIL